MQRDELAPDLASPASLRLMLAGVPLAQRAAAPPLPLGLRDAVMLAWLALEGPTPRTRLAQLLWPDSDADAARNALRQRLFHLRRQVGEGLVAGTATLSLGEGVEHDLAHSDGVLGEGRHDFGAELSAWLEQQRGRRRARTRQSLVELCDMAAQARDYADALSHARELLALEPLSEEAHRRVMQLHYLAGDRAAALQAFDRCEQVLKHEVGAQPAAETLALLAHVEASAHAGATGLQPQVLPASLLRPPRAIGRERESEALAAAWRAAQPFVLLGESGMGKSRLLEGLASAWPGALVVSARPGDQQVPLALVTRLIELLCLHQPAWMQHELVRDLRLLTLGDAAQALRRAPRSLALPLQSLLMLALAEAPPLALLLDDWQFADDASVDLLHEVLAAAALRGLLHGFASRTLAGPPAEQRVARLQRCSGLRSVVLAPLSEAAVSELVATLQVQGTDAAPLAHALVDRVGGNPLHILETLRHMLETRVPMQAAQVVAPGHVKQLVATRLNHLPEAARQVLRVAAVAGADFSVPLAEAVCGRDALVLWDDWGLLERMGLFDAHGIAHDLYAEAVQETLPTAIGKVLHGRVAAWLEGQPHEPARLAAHWHEAGEERRALPHLKVAARKAWFASRPPEVFDFFRRAGEIELASGDADAAFDLWFDNADAMSEIGSPEQVARCLQAIEPLARSEQQLLRLRLIQAVLRFVNGDVEAGACAVIDLLSDAIALGDTRVECECRFAIANRATADGHFDEALQHLAAGERLLRQAGDDRRANALAGSRAMVLGMRGQSRLAIREHERMLPLLQQTGDLATWTVACSAKALQHLREGDAEQAYAQVKLALASVVRVAIAPPDTMVILRNAVDTLRWSGHFNDALRVCDEFAQRLALQGNYPRANESAVGLYLQLGRMDLAQPLLKELQKEPFVRVRERLRIGLLQLQAEHFSGPVAEAEWPVDTVMADDLPLALEWALWSGLQAESPWPVAQLLALLERCSVAQLSLMERPLRALVARRLLEVGDTARARSLLPAGAASEVLRGLHAATPWAALFGAQALGLTGQHGAANGLARRGAEWLQQTAQTQMPEPFCHSFLHRHPLHRELLARAAALHA